MVLIILLGSLIAKLAIVKLYLGNEEITWMTIPSKMCQKIRCSKYTDNAINMWEKLAHHLFTNGSVPWQMDYIRQTGQELVNDIDNIHISFDLSHFVISIISTSWHVLIKYTDNLTMSLTFLNNKNCFLIRLGPSRAFWFPPCIILLSIYLPFKKIFIALDKANWSQPKMEKSYIYIKA